MVEVNITRLHLELVRLLEEMIEGAKEQAAAYAEVKDADLERLWKEREQQLRQTQMEYQQWK